jgi:AraC family transcriptional activator of pobA
LLPDYCLENSDSTMTGFRVYELEPTSWREPTYSRQDFYKISLLTGRSIVQYEDHRVVLQGTCLFFGNPDIPYAAQVLSAQQTGYACLFAEEFLVAPGGAESIRQSPFFRRGGTPVLLLRDEQVATLTSLFQKMLAEQDSAYRYKSELLGSYLRLLLHEASRLAGPTETGLFPYYFRLPGPATSLGVGWRTRRRSCPAGR